jgi:hypothetical protein
MDLSTLDTAYAAVLFACACSLTITWRQNPTQVGPRSWAIASGLGALALVIFAVAGLDKTQLWINVFANLVA